VVMVIVMVMVKFDADGDDGGGDADIRTYIWKYVLQRNVGKCESVFFHVL